MKRTAAYLLVLGLAVAAMHGAVAAEVTAGADVASAYVFRGTTFNDGFVLQPHVDVAGLPFEFGVWGNLDIDDMDGALDSGQFSEVDIYASYSLPLGIEGLDVSVGYCEYLYPGLGGGVDADGNELQGESDREASVTIGLPDLLLAPALTLAYGLDGAVEESLHAELGVEHSFELTEKLGLDCGAVVAYEEPDEGESGFSYYTASVGLSYAGLSASVTYVGQIDDDVLVDVEAGGGYDVEVYGMIGASYTF